MRTTDPRFCALLRRPLAPVRRGDAHDDRFSNRIKTFFKQWPRLYAFLRETVGPTYSPGNRYRLRARIQTLFGDRARGKVIVNLGSGTSRLHPDVINLDLFAFANVDIVADISDMPFKDAVVDGIILDDVLEHIADTDGALKEIARIMKPGGTCILTAPFMYPYHSSPDDFFRWTEDGIRRVLTAHGFSILERGVRGGPMGTLQAVLMHLCATALSFGSPTAYFLLVQFFMVLFSPLKLLDPFFMLFPFSSDAASDLFIIAEKHRT